MPTELENNFLNAKLYLNDVFVGEIKDFKVTKTTYRYSKYLKRRKNRQALYEKKKRLGRV